MTLNRFEAEFITKLRQMINHGYGECSFVVHNHLVKDVRISISISESHKKWTDLQQKSLDTKNEMM
jgi:hypothetical protein